MEQEGGRDPGAAARSISTAGGWLHFFFLGKISPSVVEFGSDLPLLIYSACFGLQFFVLLEAEPGGGGETLQTKALHSFYFV